MDLARGGAWTSVTGSVIVLRKSTARRIREAVAWSVTRHSQTRRTLQPERLSKRATRMSRRLLSSTFLLQNATLLFDGRLHRGQPCQKHPSTNKATFILGQAKSGFPATCQCLRYPLSPERLRTFIIACSVVRLPRLLTDAMIRDRTSCGTRSTAGLSLNIAIIAQRSSEDPRE
jgi:hypothetical protein